MLALSQSCRSETEIRVYVLSKALREYAIFRISISVIV